MAALRAMIKYQKLDYDFGFSTVEFSTDLRILVVSEGPSILPVSNFLQCIFSKTPTFYCRAISPCQYVVKASM